MKTKMRIPSGHSKRARQVSPIQKSGIYQLKVELARSRPQIWRRVLVPGNCTLAALHSVLQRVMGWYDEHLHEFESKGTSYGKPTGREAVFSAPVSDERRAVLEELMPAAGQSFRYIYDFGDNWIHEITVEKILLPEGGIAYPLCLGGENACPPEDCGGIYGYHNKLEILKDPGHPDHESVKEWMGHRVDPNFFNLEAINSSLRVLFKRGYFE